MVRSALGKVAWVGRTASMVFGLALVLALIFGVTSMAFGANGQSFLLGRFNAATALTKLTGNVNGAAMQVVNSNTGINDTALNLSVQAGEAPMAVNSATKVANLNADRLDGQDSTAFVQGRGKVYVGRLVVPTSNPFPDGVVLSVPGFADVRPLNCRSDLVNVDFSSRETFSGWIDHGAADPGYSSLTPGSGWSTSFQATERTTFHLSAGTNPSAKAATIDVYTAVHGSNCIYSATAQVWGQ